MIKKTVTVMTMFILSTALIWAVWEGNAASGSREEFPAGLFAFSDLFPKHTLIEIVNLEKDTKSRAVVIGNAGTEALLVKLSPDLANVLEVKTGNTVRVRVSVPPYVAEDGADPMLLGKKMEDMPIAAPALAKMMPASKESPVAKVTKSAKPAVPPPEVREPVRPVKTAKKNTVAPVSEVTKPVLPVTKKAVPSAPSEVGEPVQPVKTAQEESAAAPVSEVIAPVSPVQKEEPMVFASVSEVPEPAERETVEDLNGSDKPVSTVDPVKALPVPVKEEIAVRHVDAIPVSERRSDLEERTEAPVPDVEAPLAPAPSRVVEAPVQEIASPEPPPIVEEPEYVEPELYDTEVSVPEYLEVPEPSVEEAPLEEEKPAAAQEAVEEPQENTDAAVAEIPEAAPIEQNIMLVPAGPRRPVGEVPPLPPTPKKTEPQKKQMAIAPAVKEEAPAKAKEPYTVDALETGAFYVQIGRFKDPLNVESFVRQYGKHYPVTVEKSPVAKETFYKVYIGPLKKDEQGATLEIFRRLGFKDAFLKKAS